MKYLIEFGAGPCRGPGRLLSRCFLAMLLATLSGCASLDPQPSYGRVADAVAERSKQQIIWSVDEADRAAARQMLDGQLSLDDAVRLALISSPALQAEYQKLGIAQARLVQSGLMSNPVFDLSYLDGHGSDTLDVDLSVNFMDVFLIPLRKRQAAASQRQAELAVTGTVLDRVGQVRQAWIAAVAARQTEAHTRNTQLLLESLDGVSEALWMAGNITRLDRGSAHQKMLENRLQLQQAEVTAQTARDTLAVVIGAWGEMNWELPDTLPTIPDSEPSLAAIEAEVVAASIELAIARERIEHTATGLEITDRSRLIPSLEAGWGAEREDGVWTDGPAVAFALPILDTGRAQKSAQQAELEQQRRQYLQLEIEIRAAARQAHRTRAMNRSAAMHLRDVVLPLSEAQLEETTRHYMAAHHGIPDVIQARLNQNENYARYVDSLAHYWQARETQSALLQGVRIAQGGTADDTDASGGGL